MERAFAIGDLHLVRSTSPEVGEDLARLVDRIAGARLYVVGDLFDLSSESPTIAPETAIEHVLDEHPAARRALGSHLERGGSLVLVSGNHDACVGAAGFRSDLARALRLSQDARSRLETTPWLRREGGLHVEHGHLYDPDNAPEHPLVPGADSLGVHFVKEFIAPTGAFRYLNTNDETPLRLFLSAFHWYGPRGPYVVYRYFRAALQILARTGRLYRGRDERAAGAELAARYAEEHGVEARVLDLCLALAAEPTTRSFFRTASRLYLDRVLATTGLLAGGALALASRRRAATVTFGLAALAMGVSWAKGHDRFGGTVKHRLRESALRVADATGAGLVVFGHTHREALEERYANTGSFSFPERSRERGRPYLEIAGTRDRPVAVRHHLGVA